MKKAITHTKLDRANLSKIHKLDELAAEHQQVVQAYVDWLIAHEVRLAASLWDCAVLV